jgi:2-oxoglutarate dehydrogenase E2 component (dihydrolipoamide succinyltransferase)
MAIEIRVPSLGESINEATVGQWLKQAGDQVAADEPLVELETDKVTVEVPAPAAGILSEIAVPSGTTVAIGSLLGSIAEGGARASAGTAPATKPVPITQPAPTTPTTLEREPSPREEVSDNDMPPSPAARKLLAESNLQRGSVEGSGRRGQLLKHDVEQAAASMLARERKPKPAPAPRAPVASGDETREERVRMTRLRQTIAKRLKEAQDSAAMLTTFNDVDMGAVMQLRRDYRDEFEKRHGVKLGMMGFFVKACVEALTEIPAVNAEIDGDDIVYKNYYHIGVAVGTERGLVVPVLRNADQMSLAEIESAIADFGARAREGKLALEELQGGTFTISNGGIYGSLLSTPILNAPQSGILGMHRIEDRAVVRDGQIVARPMMYLALSYDHRLVDGKEAVTFLIRVKEAIEDPKRLVLNI